MGAIKTLSYIARHPLNQGRLRAALIRYLRWQIGSRLALGPVVVPFVEGSSVIVSPGMTGLTGIVYSGLSEFEDMGFALHLLREDDLFVDVGANVGSYTVLAASVGASVACFEPVESSMRRLCENLRLNGFESIVETHISAVGSISGSVAMTTDRGTVNRVILASESNVAGTVVPVETLDEAFSLRRRNVTLLKIDVEGWEREVVQGAQDLFDRGLVSAVVVEMNGSGRHYGVEDAEVDELLRTAGFEAVGYDPLRRRLMPPAHGGNNVIYVQDKEWAQERVRTAPLRTLPWGTRF